MIRRAVFTANIVQVRLGLLYNPCSLLDGSVIGGFGRTASGLDDIPEQVARLSSRLRERFGEPLREIHDDRSEGAETGS